MHGPGKKLLTSNQGIEWHFNPPAAPHFNGVFERMIKLAKRAIYAILKEADVNDEELQTVFTGADSLLNFRPLTTVSGEVNDETALTPSHFLIGQMGGELAPDTVDTTAVNGRKRWRRVQQLIRRVWSRWMREYLRAVCCKDQLRSCNIEKIDFPKLCQNKGLGELVLKI